MDDLASDYGLLIDWLRVRAVPCTKGWAETIPLALGLTEVQTSFPLRIAQKASILGP
jgi:hypothetical protein